MKILFIEIKDIATRVQCICNAFVQRQVSIFKVRKIRNIMENCAFFNELSSCYCG